MGDAVPKVAPLVPGNHDLAHIYTYVYMHTYTHIHTYIHMHMYLLLHCILCIYRQIDQHPPQLRVPEHHQIETISFMIEVH